MRFDEVLTPIHLSTLYLAWATLRPQLEETIRLRKDKMFRIARSQCLSSRRVEVQDFAKSMVKSNEVKLFLLYAELLRLPDVSNIINADGLHNSINEKDMQIIKTSALDLGTRRFQEEGDLCGAAMMVAFAECGLLPSDEMTSNCDQDESSRSASISVSNILEHCCAIFKYANRTYRPQTTFSSLISDLQHWGSGYLLEQCTPDTQTILITKKLAEDMDVIHSTTSELNLFKDGFVCARCDPIFRKRLDWVGLVRCTCSHIITILANPFP